MIGGTMMAMMKPFVITVARKSRLAMRRILLMSPAR